MCDPSKQPFFTLNSGHKIPAVGLGTFQSAPGKVYEVVKKAILEDGFRHIDCAMIYNNEEEVGKAFEECFAAGIKREDLYVTGKLWHTEKNNVEAAVDACLKRLKLDYIDLYLIHWMTPGVTYPEDGSAP